MSEVLDINQYYQKGYVEKDESAVEDFFEKDASFTGLYGVCRGLEQLKSGLRLVNNTFDIESYEVNASSSFGNLTMSKVSLKAKLLIDYMGLNTQGRSIVVEAEYFYRWHNNKVQEGHFICDFEQIIMQFSRNKRYYNKELLAYQDRLMLDCIANKLRKYALKLPPQPLRCTLLKYYGAPIKMIANIMSCSTETISSHLKFARQKYRDELGPGSLNQLVGSDNKLKLLVQFYCRFLLFMHAY